MENHHEILHRRRAHSRLNYSLQLAAESHLERDTLIAELGCIRRDVPPEVMAATACPAVAD
eukprot:3713345-Prymnesium_polylepis.1